MADGGSVIVGSEIDPSSIGTDAAPFDSITPSLKQEAFHQLLGDCIVVAALLGDKNTKATMQFL